MAKSVDHHSVVLKAHTETLHVVRELSERTIAAVDKNHETTRSAIGSWKNLVSVIAREVPRESYPRVWDALTSFQQENICEDVNMTEPNEVEEAAEDLQEDVGEGLTETSYASDQFSDNGTRRISDVLSTFSGMSSTPSPRAPPVPKEIYTPPRVSLAVDFSTPEPLRSPLPFPDAFGSLDLLTPQRYNDFGPWMEDDPYVIPF